MQLVALDREFEGDERPTKKLAEQEAAALALQFLQQYANSNNGMLPP